jgi:hypothetical protein
MKTNSKQLNIDYDDLIRIRSIIFNLTSIAEELLTDGLPKPRRKGRSQQERMDNASADEEWHETRWQVIRAAEAYLEETKSILEEPL